MTHAVAAVKTGKTPHDIAELQLITPAEHARRCPDWATHGEENTPEQNARHIAWFLREHLNAETVRLIGAELSKA